jgi:hypothetical protein
VFPYTKIIYQRILNAVVGRTTHPGIDAKIDRRDGGLGRCDAGEGVDGREDLADGRVDEGSQGRGSGEDVDEWLTGEKAAEEALSALEGGVDERFTRVWGRHGETGGKERGTDKDEEVMCEHRVKVRVLAGEKLR